MANAFLFLAAFIIVVQVDCQDYCKICTNHTMCIYSGTSAGCGQIFKRGTTDAERKIILDEHNKYRQKVAIGGETRGNPGPQPQASNMKIVTWNTEIANICQRWADQCQFKHDTCRNTNGAYVGQNLALTSSTGSGSDADWVSAIKMWYEEVPAFNSGNISPYRFDSKVGHYTQLVWADTTMVGCAYISYKTSDSQWYQKYYCCNYSPGGNIIGGDMYKKGTPCSSCTGSCNTQYTALCN